MNIPTILKHGHENLLTAIARVPSADLTTEGVCGVWSVKDIIAHLASIEHTLAEVLQHHLGRELDTPYFNVMCKLGREGFNTKMTTIHDDQTFDAVLADYKRGYESVQQVLAQMSDELLNQPGLGAYEYDGFSLNTFMVVSIYGHKREHTEQIVRFCATQKVGQ